MRTLDRYLGRIILYYSLVTMLVLLGLFTFVTFLDQLGDLGRGAYDLPAALRYVALVIPRTLYDLFPMAVLVGAIIGLSMLAGDSELIVMRASGVSLWQITRAVLKTGGVFVVAAISVGELLAPPAETRAQRGRAEALQQDVRQHTDFGLWMRDEGNYINVGEVLPDLTLLGVRVFEFDDRRRLRAVTRADSGVFRDGHWLLDRPRRTAIGEDGDTEVQVGGTREWQTRVTPQILSVFLTRPEQLSFMQLRRYIRHLDANRQETGPYELAFWNKIMLPVSTAVMVVLAIPFVFANIRSGALGRNLFLGIMLGIGFYVAHRGFGYVVLAQGLPPLAGATLPVAAFLLPALLMMRRIR